MKAIVTGGAGFIGSHLVDALLARQIRVTAIDNFSSGRPHNLEQQRQNDLLTVVCADVNDTAAIEQYFVGTNWVFHLAGLADIVPSIEQPLLYHRANVDGTVNILELSRRSNVSRFLYAASSSCYGIPDIYPTAETAPLRPQYPYALTKMIGELAALHWHQVYGLPVVALRFFNVYGPRSRTSGSYGAVFGVFLAQKLAGEPFTVVGDGSQTRDFTYVADVVSACIAAVESDQEGEVFNVGSGTSQSINRLVALLGGPSVHIPKRPGEPAQTLADITRIRKVLDWSPQVSFEEGVSRMLSQIDYWQDAPVWTPERIAEATAAWFEQLGPEGNDRRRE